MQIVVSVISKVWKNLHLSRNDGNDEYDEKDGNFSIETRIEVLI